MLLLFQISVVKIGLGLGTQCRWRNQTVLATDHKQWIFSGSYKLRLVKLYSKNEANKILRTQWERDWCLCGQECSHQPEQTISTSFPEYNIFVCKISYHQLPEFVSQLSES